MQFESTVTVRYSHAAPFIRRDLARAAGKAPGERVTAARARVDGIRAALEILVASDDYESTAGIADRETLSANELQSLVALLGSDYERLIGEPPATAPSAPALRVADAPRESVTS